MSDELSKPALSTVADLLQRRRRTIEGILSKSVNHARFLQLISSAIQQTPKLLQCTPLSVINCVVTAAQMGLEIRKNSAYLVPFDNSKFNRTDCNLLIDYRGKIGIAHRSGFVRDLQPMLVYEADEFEMEYGSNSKFRHIPKMVTFGDNRLTAVSSEDRGAVVLGYCIAELSSGGKHFEVMSHAQIEGIHKRSRGAWGRDGKPKSDSPWTTDWEQQARKTTIHRIFNYLPSDEAMAYSQEADDKYDKEEPLELLPGLNHGDKDSDELPMVEKLPAEEVKDMGEKKAAEVKVKPSMRKTVEISKFQPREVDGVMVPVMADLPPIDQVTDMQMIFVRKAGVDRLFRYEGASGSWFEMDITT